MASPCPIVEFYAGRFRDQHGRKLEQIWDYDHVRLEDEHDFIQFLFPSDQPSQFQNAPLVTADTIAAFAADPALRTRLARSLDVMLDFYGLHYDPESGRVVRGKNFAERAANWLAGPNHNFLRVTRILKSLSLLGLPDRARAFLVCLEDLNREYSPAIGTSIRYWRAAVA